MEIYAENLQFEKAAQLRDRLKAISKINEQQKMVFASSPEQDIIALQQGENETCAVVLKFRQERLVDKEDFILGIMLGYDRLLQCERYLKRKDFGCQHAKKKDFDISHALHDPLSLYCPQTK